jgi:hypothetical protein
MTEQQGLPAGMAGCHFTLLQNYPFNLPDNKRISSI